MQPINGIVAPYTELHKVIQELRETIKEALDACPELHSVDSVITLSTAPSQLHRNKRRYSLLFMSEATTFNLNIPGIGQFPLTLGIGWNELEESEEARDAEIPEAHEPEEPFAEDGESDEKQHEVELISQVTHTLGLRKCRFHRD